MLRRTELARLCVAVAALAMGMSCSKSVDDYIASGDRYLAQKQLHEAALEYRNAVQKEPTSGLAHKKLADVLEQSRDDLNALREYVRAADLLPDDLDLQVKAGTYLLRAEKPGDARARAENVLAKHPEHLDAQILLASSLTGLKDLDGAIREIQEAIQLAPGESRAYAGLGALQIAKGNRDAAEVAYKRAVELDPKSVAAGAALGKFYWLTGRESDAEREFRRIHELDPKNIQVNNSLAMLMVVTERTKEAEPYLRAIAEVSKDATARFVLADYYMALRRNADAMAILQSLATEPPHWGSAKTRIADLQNADGQKEQAYKTLAEVLAKEPANAPALLVKARILASENKTDEALATARAATTADPRMAAAHYLAGTLLAAKNDTDQAISSFREVVKLNPRAAGAQYQIARLELEKGDPRTAAQYAQQAVSSQPQNPVAKLMLARALMANAEVGRAESELKTLLAAYPDAAPVVAEMGTQQRMKRDVRGARQSFERALELDGTSYEAIAGLVMLDLAARKYKEAVALVEGELARRPTAAPLVILAARTYAAAGDDARAEASLKKAVENDPANLEACTLLGQLYLSQRRLDQALKEFDQLSKLQPRPAGAHTMVGIVLEAQGKPEEARKRYEAALAADPAAAVAANNLAWLTAESGGNLDVALQLAQTAKQRLPHQPQVDDTLGWIYYKRGLPKLALPPLELAVRRLPQNPVYRFHLGLAYLKCGEVEKGRASLSQALKLNPNFRGAAEARKILSEPR